MQKKGIPIEVTGEMIASSMQADSNHCMIADAIKAAIPHAKHISVDLQCIRYSDSVVGKRFIYLTPETCQQHLVAWDQGTFLAPWSFTLPRRADQIAKILSHKTKPNVAARPSAPGPRHIKNPSQVAAGHTATVEGGHAPPIGLLSHTTGGGRKGRRRIFGIKAAGKVYSLDEHPAGTPRPGG